MAQIMKYSDVQAFTNTVWMGAMEIARAENYLARTVTTFTDQRGMAPRSATIWGQGGTFRQIAETDDLTPTHIARTQGETLTPYEYGDQHVVTYVRLRSEAEDARAQAAKDLGQNAALTVEKHLISLFPSLTGGTVGAAGSVITYKRLFAARAILQGANVRGPYFCVLHPYQVYALHQSMSIANLTLNKVPEPGDYNAPFEIYRIGDITIISDNNIAVDGSDDAVGAFYTRDAMALDLRQPFTLMPDDDPSARLIELNAVMTYAYGVWRPSYGIKMVFDASTPTGA